MNTNDLTSGLVSGAALLEQLFPDPTQRPGIRWLRTRQKRRTFPHYKVGGLVLFNVAEVQAEIANNLRVGEGRDR